MTLSKLTSNSNYSIEKVGGKLFNLQKLNNNGFKVPETYFLDTESINDIIENKLDLVDAFSRISAQKKYAVRSSGLVEDSQDNSYAGMFDTYLNVPHGELNKFVLLCAQSVRNSRLKSYQKTFGLLSNNNICVIIQEMIDADLSGVCFTIHPTTYKSNVLVVEFGTGLGDKIVSGEVSPITLIVDKSQNYIEQAYMGDYDESIVHTNTTILISLFEICKRIENLYNLPVDIEFAVKDNNIFILQTRPITSIGAHNR